jgi:hypothetical protein
LCRGEIAHVKSPRYIEFVSEFPMPITGKIQKYVMRERMMEKLGLKRQTSVHSDPNHVQLPKIYGDPRLHLGPD